MLYGRSSRTLTIKYKMKNTNGVSKFINSDIEKAKQDLQSKLESKTNALKTVPQKAIELGKKYNELKKESERELKAIEKEIEELGCDIDNSCYGNEQGKVKLNKPNFPSYYGRHEDRTICTIAIGDFTPEMKELVKEHNTKINKLDALKRSFAIKLLGGAEVEKLLQELAKKLAEIIA